MISIEKWIPHNQVQTGAPVLKLIFLGECNTGKTSLYNKIDMISVKNHRSIGTQTFVPTTGVDIKEKGIKIGRESYYAQICDFPGNEDHVSNLGTNFFRNTLGAFIVFDINDKDSFARVDQWAAIAKMNCHSDLVICLIGNKVDLRSEGEAVRQVSEEEIMNKSKEIGAAFYAQTCAIKKEFDIIERGFWKLVDQVLRCHTEEELWRFSRGRRLNRKNSVMGGLRAPTISNDGGGKGICSKSSCC